MTRVCGDMRTNGVHCKLEIQSNVVGLRSSTYGDSFVLLNQVFATIRCQGCSVEFVVSTGVGTRFDQVGVPLSVFNGLLWQTFWAITRFRHAG